MNRKHLLTAFTFWFFLSPVWGQNTQFSKLSQFLDSLENHEKFMGVLSITQNDQVLFQKAVGWADQEREIPLTLDTKLRIGSITKMFTTVLVFQAIEEKKLSLDQSLADFYPEIQHADKITISQLLSHRSGIFNFTNRLDYPIYRTKVHQESQLLEMMKEGGSIFTPDSKADYSNSNFVLLTWILERVYQKTYPQLLEERIIQPLNLKATSIFDKIDPENGEARSYLYNGKWELDLEADPSVPLGAGALESTVGDLSIFISALFEGRLVSSESLELMKEIKEGYGRGMFSFPYYERRSYGHTGGIDGFRSFLAYFPEDKVSLAVLSNGMNYNNNDILLASLNSLFGREWELPDFTEIQISEELMGKYVGTYSSTQIPMLLTVENKGGKVAVQLTGQPQSVLEASSISTFELKSVGATFTFDPEKNQVTLKQGPATILFSKKQ